MDVTGVILAGGRSSRMGEPKALLRVGGVPIIERVARALRQVAGDLVVVTHDESLAAGLGARVVVEQDPHRGPLHGLAAGLRAGGDANVVVGCDMPFLSGALLLRMTTLLRDNDAVAVESAPGRLEPLHAVYARSCLAVAEALVASGESRASALLEAVNVQVAGVTNDAERLSWAGVNTPDELRAAEAHFRTARYRSASPL